jgi:hypothetical protein
MSSIPVKMRQTGLLQNYLDQEAGVNMATHSDLFSKVVVEALLKEPKKRTFFDMQALTAMAMEKTFFAEFVQMYSKRSLQDLLRRCYYE